MMYMYVQVKKRVIRGLARIATGKEAVTISRHANDDGIPKRTASDGRTSNPFEVNLCKKEEVLRFGTWNVCKDYKPAWNAGTSTR